MAEEFLDCNDVSCPDVHLCGPRGPEVVRLHLLIEHSVHLLEHCMDKCILMSIVHEQLCAVVELFTYLYFKLAANLLHLVPQLVRDVHMPHEFLLFTVELKAIAVL